MGKLGNWPWRKKGVEASTACERTFTEATKGWIQRFALTRTRESNNASALPAREAQDTGIGEGSLLEELFEGTLATEATGGSMGVDQDVKAAAGDMMMGVIKEVQDEVMQVILRSEEQELQAGMTSERSELGSENTYLAAYSGTRGSEVDACKQAVMEEAVLGTPRPGLEMVTVAGVVEASEVTIGTGSTGLEVEVGLTSSGSEIGCLAQYGSSQGSSGSEGSERPAMHVFLELDSTLGFKHQPVADHPPHQRPQKNVPLTAGGALMKDRIQAMMREMMLEAYGPGSVAKDVASGAMETVASPRVPCPEATTVTRRVADEGYEGTASATSQSDGSALSSQVPPVLLKATPDVGTQNVVLPEDVAPQAVMVADAAQERDQQDSTCALKKVANGTLDDAPAALLGGHAAMHSDAGPATAVTAITHGVVDNKLEGAWGSEAGCASPADDNRGDSDVRRPVQDVSAGAILDVAERIRAAQLSPGAKARVPASDDGHLGSGPVAASSRRRGRRARLDEHVVEAQAQAPTPLSSPQCGAPLQPASPPAPAGPVQPVTCESTSSQSSGTSRASRRHRDRAIEKAKLKLEQCSVLLNPKKFTHFDREMDKLGSGSFGCVYRSVYVQIVPVAIKVMEMTTDQDVAAFLREVDAMRAAQGHDNIVKFVGTCFNGTEAWLIMERVEGGTTLRDYLNNTSRSGPIPDELAMSIMAELSSAMEHIHRRGILHLDIKPENILLTKKGHVQLTDFGVARCVDNILPSGEKDGKPTYGLVGTPEYMSPEVTRGEKPTKASDMYSFAVVVFQLLFGHMTYEDETHGGLPQVAWNNRSAIMQWVKTHTPKIPRGPVRKGFASSVNKTLKELLRSALTLSPEGRPSFQYVTLKLEDICKDVKRQPQGVSCGSDVTTHSSCLPGLKFPRLKGLLGRLKHALHI